MKRFSHWLTPPHGWAVMTAWTAAAICAWCPVARGQVHISELMYHPPGWDEPGEFLELHNPSASAVDLSNWCIDGVDFCFPGGSQIQPGAYVLLADDGEAFEATYGFAADFVYAGQLANSGEEIALLNGIGAVVESLTYTDVPPWPVTPDGEGTSLERISFAHGPDTPRNWRASTDPAGHTVGAANSVSATELPPWIENVQFDANPSASTDLIVTASVLDADSVTLHYRIGFDEEIELTMLDDGASDDGAAGDGMFGALIPGQPPAALIRFRIEASGPTGTMMYPRDDDTVVYDGTVVADPALNSELPIVHWYVDPVDYQAMLDAIPDKIQKPAVIYYDETLIDSATCRVQGFTSVVFPKKNWRINLPQGHDLVAPAIIDTPVDEFVLRASWADKSFLRERMSFRTFERAGTAYPVANHVRLLQNGEYFGLYLWLEEPDPRWLERNGLSQDGSLYESRDTCQTRALVNLPILYDKKHPKDDDYVELYDFLQGINQANDAARREYLFDNLNIPATLNYLAVQSIIHNNDHVAKNFYLYRDTQGTGRWWMTPWDMDLTFGRNYNGVVLNDVIWADVDEIDGLPDVSPSHPLFGDEMHKKYDFYWNRLIDVLYKEPDFVEMHHRRLRSLMDEFLPEGGFECRIDQLVPLLSTEAAEDKAKWGQYGTAQSIEEAAAAISDVYLPLRRVHLFETHQNSLEIPAAQVALPAIVINEIMYDPFDGEDAEYIELHNPSTTDAVDVSRWSINGVDVTLPPGSVIAAGGYALVVKHDATFRQTYGGGVLVLTEYDGHLDDGGENLKLLDATGTLIDQVRYDDDAPWPTQPADGFVSLELMDALADNDRAISWSASLEPGGTPGYQNSTVGTAPAVPDLWVNEVLPVNGSINTDEFLEFAPWIELYNGSNEAIEIGGMFLTNDYDVPMKWEIPAGTSIPAGDWLIVWADNEPGDGPLHANFALSAAGGSAGLYTSDGLIVDYLNYDPLPVDVSYGKFPDGTSVRSEFVTPTPSAANVLPAARIILNEYNAVSGSGFLKEDGFDTFFGVVPGNGGDWFELVVIEDHLDIRGWQLVISDDTGGAGEDIETLTLTQDVVFSDLRSGTILTIAEDVPTDVGYDPEGGDYWINIQAANGTSGQYITATNFKVSNSNWQLTILDNAGAIVFGPAGEGVQPVSGIGSDEVFALDESPDVFTTPLAKYSDSVLSTFGAPNAIDNGEGMQDLSELCGDDCAPPTLTVCECDIDCDDGNVCTEDLCDPDSGCVYQNAPEGTDCDDGTFCNGISVCVEGVCQEPEVSCAGECQSCDEDSQSCSWCLFDLNQNEVVDGFDFSEFAGCFGLCTDTNPECTLMNFDDDDTGCIDASDFALFSACFGLTCGACDNCWGPTEDDGGGGDQPWPQAHIQPVIRHAPTIFDAADQPPSSVDSVSLGSNLYVELWAARTGTLRKSPDGFAAIYLDLMFDDSRLSPSEVIPSEEFGSLTQSSLRGRGVMRDLGGCTVVGDGTVGVSTEWVKVSTVRMQARRLGKARIHAAAARGLLGVAVYGRSDEIQRSSIVYDRATFEITNATTTPVNPKRDE